MKLSLAQKLKESLKMFLVFFKIGLFSFGGGYAMLTMIEHEVVEKRGWLTHNELLDIFAIAESTPGAISINIATFIGTKRAGVIGGCITTFGVVLPAFLVIFALSYVLDLVRDNVWVNALFKGVRVGVVVLIIHAALKFLKEMKKKVVTVLLAVAMFCLAAFSSVNVIWHLNSRRRRGARMGEEKVPDGGLGGHPRLHPQGHCPRPCLGCCPFLFRGRRDLRAHLSEQEL